MIVHLYACDTDNALFLREDPPHYVQYWSDRAPRLVTPCPHRDFVLDHRVRYLGATSLEITQFSKETE